MTEKAEEYRRRLEEAEREKAAAMKAEAKKFDVKALAESTRKIYVLKDPDLGEIRYGLLSQAEFAELHLDEVQSDAEKAERVIHAMLRKADPSLTWEDFQALPFDVRGALTMVMSQLFTRFLRVQQRVGSAAAQRLKQSA